jgi:hypothetical protein
MEKVAGTERKFFEDQAKSIKVKNRAEQEDESVLEMGKCRVARVKTIKCQKTISEIDHQ